MRSKKGKYTGEKTKARKLKQDERQTHIQAIHKGEESEELPKVLLPNVFKDIQEVY